MLDPVRQEIATTSDTLVVKVGTRVLTSENRTLDLDRVTSIAEQLSRLIKQGKHIALVSSGAVGAGMGRLGIHARPRDLAQLQAVAALGQSGLIEAYNRALQSHGHPAAQVLLSADDFNDRTRYLNVRNTLLSLFQYGAVPVINENDTVRTEELKRNVGDNDRLAAMVTNLIRAPLLVLLSDVAGLYDGDPEDPASKVIPLVDDLGQTTQDLVHDSVAANSPNQISKGGMSSKLQAAQIATSAGENVIIADGRNPKVLDEIMAGKVIGTLFLAQSRSITSRKRWIGLTAEPAGKLIIDAGAERAIVEQGRSLLAVGIKKIEGNFRKGDIIILCGEGGTELARGLINYPSEEINVIAGHPTGEIDKLLGHRPYDEVIHRDNLVRVP